MILAGVCAPIAGAQAQATYSNPVLPGDYPDPSVIRVGRDYWATATTSEWGPEFPLLHSRDLVSWRQVGAVFSRRPRWSVGNYWAPEIAEHQGRYFVYYVARKKDGPLCVGVATAASAAGPYTDRGPMVCQEAGSIDPVAVTDERGERYLVWKEDGNSRNLPTPIWAQRLSADGTRLVGEMKELIRNDAPWEAQLVEGPFIVRRNGWFYLFYSGNACCGRECNYALGVARSRKLSGPWEKNPANPILRGNEKWKCPGHGSIVSDRRGRDFLLYHAYDVKDFVYVGRQALLDEVRWNRDGWPSINDGNGPGARKDSPARVRERNESRLFFDDFTAPRLRPGWQWPQSNEPVVRVDTGQGGRVRLAPSAAAASDVLGAVLARATTTGDYVATALVDVKEMKAGALAGLSAYGDEQNALGVAVGGGRVTVWRREKNDHKTVATTAAPAAPVVYLRMRATGGHRFRFDVSGDGRQWKQVGEEVEGRYLPPWDRGVRVALTASGTPSASARFEWLRIEQPRLSSK